MDGGGATDLGFGEVGEREGRRMRGGKYTSQWTAGAALSRGRS